MCGGVAHSQKNFECTTDHKRGPWNEWLSTRHQAVFTIFLGFRKPPYSCIERMCQSSTHPPNVHVHHCMWSVLPGFPHISMQATNAGVRRPRYEAYVHVYVCTTCSLVPRPSPAPFSWLHTWPLNCPGKREMASLVYLLCHETARWTRSWRMWPRFQ